jgi:hypothetical protein
MKLFTILLWAFIVIIIGFFGLAYYFIGPEPMLLRPTIEDVNAQWENEGPFRIISCISDKNLLYLEVTNNETGKYPYGELILDRVIIDGKEFVPNGAQLLVNKEGIELKQGESALVNIKACNNKNDFLWIEQIEFEYRYYSEHLLNDYQATDISFICNCS